MKRDSSAASHGASPRPPAAARHDDLPQVPLQPVLGACVAVDGGSALPSVLEAGPFHLVTSARVALALALQALGIGDADGVLLPAYHSPAMVAAVRCVGARPLFYRIGPDTHADLADLEHWMAQAGPRPRALIATHFFGFPQALEQLRNWCDRHGLALIEDCAHSHFGRYQGRPLGSFGDFAATSAMKFYPVMEGGALVAGRRPLPGLALRGAGLAYELKSCLNTLERAFAYGRLPGWRRALHGPLALQAWLWRQVRRRHAAPVAAPAASYSGTSLEPEWLDKRPSRFSRLLMARLSAGAITTRRRQHYQRLHAALGELPGARPLFATLPDDVVPWMYPLWVERADLVFERLHQAGVPLTRFAYQRPDVAPGRCPVSDGLARHVLALPCHQALRPEELAWIIATIEDLWPA